MPDRDAAAQQAVSAQAATWGLAPLAARRAIIGAMTEPDERVDVQLTHDERYMLQRGLGEWGGPAHCSNALAVAMGFADRPDMRVQRRRISDELEARQPLSRLDWSRTLMATEIVFASEVVGAASDWLTTTGMDDIRSIEVLRSLQNKLSRYVGLIDPGLGPPK